MNITEFKAYFQDRLSRLEKAAIDLSREERVDHVAALLEEHYKVVGKNPITLDIIRLSNIILVEELKDRKKNKVRTKEFPFLSERQIQTRKNREFSLEGDTIDFLFQKEVKKMSSAFKKRTKNKED